MQLWWGNCGITLNVNILLKQITLGKFRLAAQLNSLTANALSLRWRTTISGMLQIDCPRSEQEAALGQAYPWRCCSHIRVRRCELCYSDAPDSWSRLSVRSRGPPESQPMGDRDKVNDAALLVLAGQSFVSVRNWPRLTRILRRSVHRRLTTSLGFTMSLLRWVPHIGSNAQKRNRAHISGERLQLLRIQDAGAWHDIATLDESWFYLSTDHELIWLPAGPPVRRSAGPPVLDRERHMIQSPKRMLTVV
jgi:hypothetical protein